LRAKPWLDSKFKSYVVLAVILELQTKLKSVFVKCSWSQITLWISSLRTLI